MLNSVRRNHVTATQHWLLCISACFYTVQFAARAETVGVDFPTQIAPIFEQHCIRCHSTTNKKGDVSLATFADLQANDFVVAGDPDGSYLIELLSFSDGEPPAMPKGADPLSEEQVSLLRRWIMEGATWPRDVIVRDTSRADVTWWSLQPLNAAGLSESSASAPGPKSQTTAIDDFIRRKLAKNELSLNPPADRRTLIRRASFDLIGLPPTPEEVEFFASDPDPQAYRRLVDRLLESPHYGERWGRHWLDVVRFGESVGYEQNWIINNIWPFRDYVIRSVNQDKPFNQFIREHIAGDVFGQDDPDVAVGSAFLVAGPYDGVGNQDAAQAARIRANTLDEIIRATGEAFLGMTLGCARCHDHKFDPITQQDYYGLYATFSGIRHGSAELATSEDRAKRSARLRPLNDRKSMLERKLADQKSAIITRAKKRMEEHGTAWTRPPVDRTGTEDRFESVTARFVRLVCDSLDIDADSQTGFCIDEFEVWSTAPSGGPSESNSEVSDLENWAAKNVALARNGGTASGQARKIEDFPGAYGPHHVIDGKTGARFISIGNSLTIRLAHPTLIDRVVFSSAKNEQTPEQRKFVFVSDYRIEVSVDGEAWHQVASGYDRQPVDGDGHLNRRLLRQETTSEEQVKQATLVEKLEATNQQIAQVVPLPSVWVGRRVAEDAQGPFHIFTGGNPQKKGEEVFPASLSMFSAMPRLLRSEGQTAAGEVDRSDASGTNETTRASYRLSAEAPEAERRQTLADWIVHSGNPLTPRVLANRVWHYHFGTGIVDTPSDFGYMGGKPSHPELLDFLALTLTQNGWRLKEVHRLIMTSRTYQQSSEYRARAAKIDGDSRLLWRFPPRRLSAEEVRDTMLQVAGRMKSVRFSESSDERPLLVSQAVTDLVPDGGPGFRLYRYMRDNVCTYVPLDEHGPETYRRAVYHQNARASVVDLMTEFDQPDCTFSTPKRATTTTPLQALTMLNHRFTLDMSRSLAERLKRDVGLNLEDQIHRVYRLCFSRHPKSDELTSCRQLADKHGLTALCRVLLNTSEMVYVH